MMSKAFGRFSAVFLLSMLLVSTADAGKKKKNKKKDRQAEPIEAPANLDDVEEEPVVRVAEPAAKPVGDDDLAVEPEAAEGIWGWVERMDGEIPTDDQRKGIAEINAQEEAEKSLLVEPETDQPLPEGIYEGLHPSVAQTDPLHLRKVDPKEFDIPITVNAAVEKWVEYFTGSGRKHYVRWMKRSTTYRPMMYEKLEKAGMPRDLVYLSMIESGYNAHAYSHAHAAGLWQFIPTTARLYDLRVDWWVDQRRDPELATDAAIAFLKELHQMFGDWNLAFAGYNTGPGRVRRALRDTGSKTFWQLAEQRKLHSETRNYVPKIMAAAIIGKHPERYGFTDIDFQPELAYDDVKITGSVEVEQLAKAADMKLADFQRLNPSLRRWASPPEGYVVHVPPGKAGSFQAAVAKIPKKKQVQFAKHTVRKGETLSRIAAKYSVSTENLRRANRLRNANRIYVGMKLVIPGRSGAPARTASSSSSSPSKSTSSTYTVRRGDSLGGIASRHGVTVSQLKSWNGLRSDTIQPGQKLKLRAGSSRSASSSSKTRTYVVRAGDTLGKIAAKHGVSASSLQSWNKIRDPSKIFVGQKLTIRGGTSSSAASWKTHTVKAGDSLGKIAGRYGVTVKQIQDWNKLRSTVIHPGQKLKIRS